jgi:hypothetical protein
VTEKELNHMRSFFGCDPAYYGMTPAEPVAWINLDRFKDEALYLADCVSENRVDNMGITTPLYTHPAKTLTDEEIKSEAKYFCHSYHSENPERLVLFARAILRKAQE